MQKGKARSSPLRCVTLSRNYPKGRLAGSPSGRKRKSCHFLPFIFFILLLLKKKLKRQQTSEMASLLDTLMLLSRLLGQCCIEFHYHHHVDVFVSSRNAYPLLLLLERSVAWWDENGCVGDYMETLSLVLSPFRVGQRTWNSPPKTVPSYNSTQH